MIRDLRLFSYQRDFKDLIKDTIWWVIQNFGFKSFLFPSRVRPMLLRMMGAKIAKGVIIRQGVRIHMPRNLSIGSNSWIGEDAWIINHEKILIGSNVCISQAAIICSSGHDMSSPSLQYKHKPIQVEDGVWVCLGAKILAGSNLGVNSVVSGAEVFQGILPANHIYRHGVITTIKTKIK